MVSGCDVLVGTMEPKRGASVVTVSLEYVGERFVGDSIPLVEFDNKVCGGARELGEETADVVKTPRRN